jgi:hypothetical protein
MTPLSIEVQLLSRDVADGCTMSGYCNGAPRIVMPRPGGPIPLTKGQVSDAAARKFGISRMATAILRDREANV